MDTFNKDIVVKLIETLHYMENSPEFNESSSVLHVVEAIETIKSLRTQLTTNTETVNQDASGSISEWLETEISAIDTMYRGSPSHTHDAYWFKYKVLSLIRKSKLIIYSQLSTPSDSTSVNDAIDSNKWQEINTANFSDDYIWLYDGVDSIEGPRPLETDDYDRYAYWAPVDYPSTKVIDAARKPSLPIID